MKLNVLSVGFEYDYSTQQLNRWITVTNKKDESISKLYLNPIKGLEPTTLCWTVDSTIALLEGCRDEAKQQ